MWIVDGHWTWTMSIGHLPMVSLDFPEIPYPLYPLYYVKRRSQLRGPFGDEGIDIIGPHVAKTFCLHPFLPCIRSQELLSQEVWAFYWSVAAIAMWFSQHYHITPAPDCWACIIYFPGCQFLKITSSHILPCPQIHTHLSPGIFFPSILSMRFCGTISSFHPLTGK